MPNYFYKAKSLDGKEQSGVLEAVDTNCLSRALRQEGLVLIKAELQKGGEVEKKSAFSFSIFYKVSLSEKMLFTRNLQVMIAAGLPLPRTLSTLAEQTKSKKFKKALLDIQEEIIKGRSFSESLNRWPDIFPDLFRNMIKVGEEAGTMENSLVVLARQMEKEHQLKSEIQGAMIYPAVIVCAMLGIGILMLVMVVPQLALTFEELGIKLPLTTRLVVGFGNFLVQKWYLFLLMVAFFVFLFFTGLKTEKGKRIIDTIFLKIPIISSIIKKSNSASTVRTLSSLIASGVPLVRALEITSGTLGNIYYKKAISESVEKVKKGEKLSEALKDYRHIYSSMVGQMVAVGEETGETAPILEKLAEFFEEEVSRAAKNLTAIIEPVLMIVIGAAIGFFAISMIQPMYSLLGGL